MTTQIVSATQIASKPYSLERMATMERADRITRVLFNARRRGQPMATTEAIAFVDAEIDAANARKVLASLKQAEVKTVATDSKAANDSNTDDSPEPTQIAFTRDSVHALVADSRFFNVEFIKRSTGELRTMQARLGVKKHLEGGSKAYDDKTKNLLTVFSTDANGYRSIPIDLIQSMTVKGTTYVPVVSLAQAA